MAHGKLLPEVWPVAGARPDSVWVAVMVSCHIFSLGCGASAAYVWAVSVTRTLAHRPGVCASFSGEKGTPLGTANTDLGILRHGGQAAQGHADRRADRRGARGRGGTHQAAPQSHGADRGRAALLLMSTTVLMQLLKLLVTFTVVPVAFTTLLVIFTVVLVQQFLWLVQSDGYSS